MGDRIKARSFLVEQIFVFIQLDLAQKAEGYLEIYALDMASILLISVPLTKVAICVVGCVITIEIVDLEVASQ